MAGSVSQTDFVAAVQRLTGAHKVSVQAYTQTVEAKVVVPGPVETYSNNRVQAQFAGGLSMALTNGTNVVPMDAVTINDIGVHGGRRRLQNKAVARTAVGYEVSHHTDIAGMMGHPHFHHMLASALNAVSSDARAKNSSGVHLPMLSGEDMFHTMDTDSIKTRVTFGASVGIQPETDAQGTIRSVESVMNPESMIKQLATDGILVRGVLVNDVNVQKAKPTLYSDVDYPDDSSTSQSGATYIMEIVIVCCCATILSLTMCYIACHRRQEDLSPKILNKQDVDRNRDIRTVQYVYVYNI